MSTIQSSKKEEMYDFFQDPHREKLREILRGYDSEYDHLDFKAEWGDNAKLAKHILAFANSGGGVIVFGIEEKEDNTLEITGLDKIKDKSDIAVDQYLPDEGEEIYGFDDFVYDSSDWDKLEGKRFQLIYIADVPEILPLVSEKMADGRISRNTIYVRKSTKSVQASNSDIERLISRRIKHQTGKESGNLITNLNQLRTLYRYKQQSESQKKFGSSALARKMLDNITSDSFESFVSKMIKKKKEHVEEDLNIT